MLSCLKFDPRVRVKTIIRHLRQLVVSNTLCQMRVVGLIAVPFLRIFALITLDAGLPLQGSCSLFSPDRAYWIDVLVGDNTFSNILSVMKTPQVGFLNFDIEQVSPLPPQEILAYYGNGEYELQSHLALGYKVSYFLEYLSTLNRNIPFFEEQHLTALVRGPLGATTHLGASSYAALSIVCAHSLRVLSGMRSKQSEQYLQGTLRTLPYLLSEPPNATAIGALLSTVCLCLFQ